MATHREHDLKRPKQAPHRPLATVPASEEPIALPELPAASILERAVTRSRQMTPGHVQRLQRAYGNRAVRGLLPRSHGRAPMSISPVRTGGAVRIQRLYIREERWEDPIHYDKAPSNLDEYMKTGQYKGEDLYERLDKYDIHYGLGSGEDVDDEDLVKEIEKKYFRGKKTSLTKVKQKFKKLSHKEKAGLYVKLAKKGKHPWRFAAQEKYGGKIWEDWNESKSSMDFAEKWKTYFHPVFNKTGERKVGSFEAGMVSKVMDEGRIRFHLDGMGGFQEIKQVLEKKGEHATAFTSEELRFIRSYWGDQRKLRIPESYFWNAWDSLYDYYKTTLKKDPEKDIKGFNSYVSSNSTIWMSTKEVALKDHVTFYKKFQPVPAPWTDKFKQWEKQHGKEGKLDDKKGGTGKGCFITTACVSARGLPDDCDELTTLRQFRDGYMRRLEGGDALIRLYYDIAPQIVASIGARQDAKSVYDHLYAVIQTCVQHVKNGSHEKALEIYVEMVKRLTRQYCPHLLS